ncbi:MAG TPA: C40 family peptidase [Bacillales bacterium]|nr:C40 family peptidase [Bacillales bacterium]
MKVDGIAGAKTLAALTKITENSLDESVPVQALRDSYLLDGTFIQHALNLIGTPYIWGGTTTNGFDCSGFLKYVFAKKGIDIPRTISEIWDYGIDVKKPSVGDLVFFETYKPGPSHAGIYLGGGQFIHSGSSKGVTISKLNQSYWSKRYLGSKRIR